MAKGYDQGRKGMSYSTGAMDDAQSTQGNAQESDSVVRSAMARCRARLRRATLITAPGRDSGRAIRLPGCRSPVRTMGKFNAFLLGALVGFGAYHFASHYHLVRAADGFHAVPKTEWTFADTVVDVRRYTVEDWARRPKLSAAVAAAGQAGLMQPSVGVTLDREVDRALEAFRGSPGSAP